MSSLDTKKKRGGIEKSRDTLYNAEDVRKINPLTSD